MMEDMTEQQIGKFVDGRSTLDKKWYAAEIVRVFENGDVRIHFPGWTPHNDEIIPASEVATQIAPLYSHSTDRRKWKAGDSVDYQCSVDFALWTPVPIVAVDHSNDSVAMQLRHEEINEVQTEHRAASTASLVKEDSVKWFKVCSDYIAPIHTFTKRTHKRTSGQALASSLSSAPATLQTLRSVTNPTPSRARARRLIVAKPSSNAVSAPATHSIPSITNTSTASVSSTPAQSRISLQRSLLRPPLASLFEQNRHHSDGRANEDCGPAQVIVCSW